jgi:hypothetical protein
MINNTFRTEIPQQKAGMTLSHNDKIMLIGSCFAENIGEKLSKYKFPTDVNPFGILFNPVSIAQSLSILSDSFLFQESDLHFHSGEWVSFLHHGKFSNSDKKECLRSINEKLVESREFLKNTDFLVLTLGSSIAYRYKGNIVANCHKIPQKEFEKQMLSVQDIVSNLQDSIEKVRAINNNIRLIFTVSPVRYIKNDVTENTLSKARLIVAVHELIRCVADSYYFPAFEIMMDDLRDYRFYSSDMAHPSPLAIDYIWKNFSYAFFNNETVQLNKSIEEVVTAKNHRLKNPFSAVSQRFKEEQLKKIQRIQTDFPHINFEDEVKYFLG